MVADRAPGRTLTDEETSAVQSALHYFHQGGKRHISDEEESLFPRLRSVSAAGGFEELDGLESDHRSVNALHDNVDTLYSAWITDGHLSQTNEQLLLSVTKQLKHLYNQHIQREEQIVFPRAAQILDSQAIAAIGKEFQARRK
jgi:iron-sulfur cluster repair protein YtfE (RIC family)